MRTIQLRALPAPAPTTVITNSYWERIRDQKVREAEVKAEIDLRRLEEEAKVLVEKKGKAVKELNRMGESEASVKAHRILARWWFGGFALASLVTIMSAWWTLNYYLSLTWEKALLALAICVLPLIGWTAFLMVRKVELSWRVTCGLGLTVILCSVLAAVSFGVGRGMVIWFEENRQQTAPTETNGELTSSQQNSGSDASFVSRVKKLLAVTTMISVILLAIAGEVGAGLAFHEYYRRMTVVWTVWPFYRDEAALSNAIADNIALQEDVKRQPQILHAQLTAEGLEAEAAREAKAAEEAEAAAKAAAEAEAKANSLGRVVKTVLIIGAVLLLTLLGIAAMVFAEERNATVVVIDLSVSMVPDEFTKAVQAVEGVIDRLPADSRLVVLGISEASFSAPPLFGQTSPKNSGRYGEHLSAWRAKAVKEWRNVADRLRAVAKGSDILGALARASTEFDETPQAAKTLIILSDMRHVGRGFNLENGRPQPELGTLEQLGLVARLEAVQVWVLGAHTRNIDISQWQDLKTFWTRYFKKAGAQLRLFSPNRRLREAHAA